MGKTDRLEADGLLPRGVFTRRVGIIPIPNFNLGYGLRKILGNCARGRIVPTGSGAAALPDGQGKWRRYGTENLALNWH